MSPEDRRDRALPTTSLGSAEFRAIIGVTLFIMLGFGLIVPTLPRFAARFGVGEAGIGLLLTVFAGTRLLGDLVAGGLIDRYGERAITALGAVIVGASSVAAGAAPSFGWLLALRGVGGVGSALFLGGLMAYVIGMTAPEERGRAMGVFQSVAGSGLVLGPLFGGVLAAAMGVNAPLYAYGAVCLASAPLILRAIRSDRVPSAALADAPDLSDPPPPPAAPAWVRLKPLLRDSAYRAALAGSGVIFLVVHAFHTLIPGLWVDTLGQSEGSIGVPFTLSALAGLVVLWHAGSLSDRRGRKFALVPALALFCVTTAAMGYVTSAGMLIVLVAISGVAGGYARPGPSAMIGDVAPPEARGVAIAGYRTAGDLGAFVGPILAGVLAEHAGIEVAFMVVAGSVAVGFVLALLARETAPALGAPTLAESRAGV